MNLTTKKTLVIGASSNQNRYSNKAIKMLILNEHDVVAIGHKKGEVCGIKIETNTPSYIGIHTVALYLRPERQNEYYNYVVNLNPKRVIFNPGTENIEFQHLLSQRGIQYENACTLVLLSTNQY